MDHFLSRFSRDRESRQCLNINNERVPCRNQRYQQYCLPRRAVFAKHDDDDSDDEACLVVLYSRSSEQLWQPGRKLCHHHRPWHEHEDGLNDHDRRNLIVRRSSCETCKTLKLRLESCYVASCTD